MVIGKIDSGKWKYDTEGIKKKKKRIYMLRKIRIHIHRKIRTILKY